MSAALFPDVIINGEAVDHAAIAAEAQHHTAPRGKPGVAWRQAARAVAIRTLLLQEARRRGLQPDPQERAPGRFETDKEALVRELLEQAVSVEPPAPEAVRAAWARDPSRFRAPPLWEVSHILIACDPRDADARAKAHDRALALSATLRADPAAFARTATTHSDCPSGANGGALGQIGPGDSVPEFEAALDGMHAGEIRPAPLLTRYGWHIIRLDALAEGAELPFDTVRPQLTEAMEKAAWVKAAHAFVADLVARADIEGADLSDPAPPVPQS